MSTTLADQLKIKTEILTKPLPVQLAVTGSCTKVNRSTTVDLQYQMIHEKRRLDIMNLDGYDLILGTPFMFQHQVLLGFNPTQVAVKSVISLPLKGNQVTMLSSLAMDLMEVRLSQLHEYASDICKTAVETPLPPLRAINHTIPLIDETKTYPWRPLKCPAPLRSLWHIRKVALR